MPISIRARPWTNAPASGRGPVHDLVSDRAGRVVVAARATANEGATAVVYDGATGATLAEGVRSAAVSDDGTRAFLVPRIGDAFVIGLAGGARRALKGARRGGLVGPDRAWSADGEAITVWDVATGRRTAAMAIPPLRARVPGAHAPSFTKAVPRGDGRTLVWLDAHFAVHLLDLEAGTTRAVIPVPTRELPADLVVARDGRTALALGTKGTCAVVDLEAGMLRSSLRDPKVLGGAPRVFAWLDDGRLVTEGRMLDVIDLARGKRASIAVGARDPNRERILAMAALPGSHVVLAIERIADPAVPFMTDTALEVWDVDRAERVARVDAPDVCGPLLATPSGRVLAVCTVDAPSVVTTWRAYEVAGLGAASVTPPRAPAAGTPSPRATAVAKAAVAKAAVTKKTGAKKTGAKKTGAKKTGAKKTGAKKTGAENATARGARART